MNALAMRAIVAATITFAATGVARSDNGATTCADAFKSFRDATEYAGMWRLNDLERAVAQACRGDSAKAADVQKILRRVETELGGGSSCRRGQALLDNAWYYDAKEGARAANAHGTSNQRGAIAEIEAHCPPPVIAAAKRRWPIPFADRDADEEASRKAAAARQAELDRNAAEAAKLREPVKVAKLIEALDAGDGQRFQSLLDAQRIGDNVLLDNGNKAWRGDLVQCFNTVVLYRRDRAACGKTEWTDASCPKRVFDEGTWRQKTQATGKYPRFEGGMGACGFVYAAFDAEIAADVALVERYDRRVASYRKLATLEAQQAAAFEQAARSAAQSQPDVLRAGVSDNLCGLYQQLDELAKYEALQHKIDRESGTVDVKARRTVATAKVLRDEQIARAKKQWGQVGGKASDGRKTTSTFWCGLPKQISVLESARQIQLRSLNAKRVPASKICGTQDWKELALATSGAEAFKTCTIENIANQKEPVPEPFWDWLREARATGEEFIYAIPIGDSVSHMVFQFASNRWTLLRIESCGYAGGSGCDELADFEVQAPPKSP